MQNFISKIIPYCTRENITLAIAILGAFGTISNWITSFLHSRRNVSIQIIKMCKTYNSVIAYISIQNNSRIPISINDISLKYNRQFYSGFNVPQHTLKVERKSGDSITAVQEYLTMTFPINLGSLSGASGYIFFGISKEVSESLSTPLIFRVSSNRGNPFEMKLESSEWGDWDKMF